MFTLMCNIFIMCVVLFMIWKIWKKSNLKSEKISKIWRKSKLNSEKIWKKGKLNSEMIWKILKISVLVIK
jgi:hypothetical protein